MRISRALGALLCLALPATLLAQADRLDRLDGLCRLWGIAKFFHPSLAGDSIDWDKALIDAIPHVEAAATPEAFRDSLDDLLKALNDPASRTLDTAALPPPGEQAGPPKVEWIKEGAIAAISARDWTALAQSGEGAFRKLFDECKEASSIILDLRRSSPAALAGMDEEAFIVGEMFKADAPSISGGTLVLPARRSRTHSGYVPQSGQSSGGYYSGFNTTEHQTLKAAASAASGKPIAILTSETSRQLTDVLAALQSVGTVTVIHEGEAAEWFSPGTSYTMQMPMGVAVRIRTADMVCPDGSIGFEPDINVHAGQDAMKIAQDVLATKAAKAPRGRPAAVVHTFDKPYADMAYPTREYRLLAVFRVWNVMRYFFPYHEHTDTPWDDTLREFIPRFEDAKDASEYGLAIREMIARLQDSHVGATGGEAMAKSREALGEYCPRALVTTVRGDAVIMKVLGEGAGIHAGDTLVEIDGKSVEDLRKHFARYSADSTRQSMIRRIDLTILRGAKDSAASITVRGLDGNNRSVTLPRSMHLDELQKLMQSEPVFSHPAHEAFSVLPEGFGYFDLVALQQRQVRSAFEKVKNTKGLIMDMRGYPKGTAWEICSRLSDTRINMAKFTRPYWTDPDPNQHVSFNFDQPIYPHSLWKYKGKVVVLIDDKAVSQSEHSCLGFEQAAKGRITFIGCPTTGANGDVTTCVLPGGVYVRFSGHDVRHSDGRQLQRVGIQPDIKIEPTIHGLIDGKDEVLEAAVAFLERGP